MSEEDQELIIESMAAEIDSLRNEVDELKWENRDLEDRIWNAEYSDCEDCYNTESKLQQAIRVAKEIHKELHKDELHMFQNCPIFPCIDFINSGVV